MADIGALAGLVLAQNVKLILGDSKDGKRVISMRQVRVPKTHPESRFNYGLDRDYQHGAPDIGISFTVSVTSDIIDELEKLSLRDSNGVIAPSTFTIEYQDNTGTDDGKKTIEVKGKLRDVEYIRNDSDQQNPVTADCFIRVIDNNSNGNDISIIKDVDTSQ